MINSITIENFQSYKDAFLELSKGVNAFIGESDAGKTAIFRAINWNVNNRPAGDEFRSWWGGDTRVGLDLEEGFLVERCKTDKDNYYSLTDSEGKEEIYRAFGQKVPEDIERILNMSEINFRFQHDGPFLLGQSPGANAKYLNSVINLDVIDTALYNINKRLRGEEQSLVREKEERKKYKEKLRDYDWLPDAEKQIKKVEGIEIEFRNLKEKYFILESLSTELDELKQNLNVVEETIKFEKKVNELVTLDAEIEGLIDIEVGLQNLTNDLGNTAYEINKADEHIRHEKKVKRCLTVLQDIVSEKETKTGIESLILDQREIEMRIKEIDEQLSDLEKEFHKLMPDRCPLCGRGDEKGIKSA
jgi:exonuclease SbcC